MVFSLGIIVVELVYRVAEVVIVGMVLVRVMVGVEVVGMEVEGEVVMREGLVHTVSSFFLRAALLHSLISAVICVGRGWPLRVPGEQRGKEEKIQNQHHRVLSLTLQVLHLHFGILFCSICGV